MQEIPDVIHLIHSWLDKEWEDSWNECKTAIVIQVMQRLHNNEADQAGMKCKLKIRLEHSQNIWKRSA